jgi:DNA modification methylase
MRRGRRPPYRQVPSKPEGRTHGDAWELVHGRCEDVLPLLPAKVFDVCITDPPYGLGIAAWDRATPGPEVWREVLRVMKAGAWLIAFGGRRTYHRVATSIEEGGFDSVDMGSWVFRNGSRPPSRNHLRPAHEGIVIARAPGKPLPVNRDAGRVPYRDEADKKQTAKANFLRTKGVRKAIYAASLDLYGKEPFTANDNGRLPTTVMVTGEDDVLGDDTYVFACPS